MVTTKMTNIYLQQIPFNMAVYSEKHQSIVQDFLRYCLFLFVPFVLAGTIYCFVFGFSLQALLFNPLIYSIGLALIIIVITHDINDLLEIIGMAKKPKLSDHITYAKEVQRVSILLSSGQYQDALNAADSLLAQAPHFATAHNLKGEILLQGFANKREARHCFDKVLKMTTDTSEEYKLAKALKASTYS